MRRGQGNCSLICDICALAAGAAPRVSKMCGSYEPIAESESPGQDFGQCCVSVNDLPSEVVKTSQLPYLLMQCEGFGAAEDHVTPRAFLRFSYSPLHQSTIYFDLIQVR